MSSQNTEIKNAIDSLDVDHARTLLREALKTPDAETWFLAAQVALFDDQKRDFLRKAVELDPFHQKAQQALRALDGGSASPLTTSSAMIPSQPDRVSAPPDDSRTQQMIDVERAIGELENRIVFIDQRLTQCNNNKVAAAVVGIVGLFLVVALIGVLILIGAVIVYNNASQEEKRLRDERLVRQNELLAARQHLRQLQS